MDLARGTPGSRAIAALAGRRYAGVRSPILAAAVWRPVAFGHPGIVYLGEPLPAHGRRWVAIERGALGIDATDLPHLRFVTGNTTMRIFSELRREGHVLG